MKILAIDTSEDACSAALMLDDAIEVRHQTAPRRHSELALPMLDELLAAGGLRLAELDALAFGRGPGSFTGIRIATAVIQGAAFAADLPVVPVSTLLALGEGARREHAAERVLAAMDARMDEVYWAAVASGDAGLMSLAGPERVGPPEQVSLSGGGDWVGVGSGWGAHADRLRAGTDGRVSTSYPEARVQARDIAVLAAVAYRRGAAVSAEQALPVYLRDEVAWKKSR